jgi:hypothetical protein
MQESTRGLDLPIPLTRWRLQTRHDVPSKMPVPLQSNVTWVEDPAGNVLAHPGRTVCRSMIAEGDPGLRVIAKRRPANVDPVEIYSIGIERVAYVLADGLGLPTPAVHLEEVDGYASSVQTRILKSRSLRQLGGAPAMAGEIRNRDIWPLAAMFDVWTANTDRREVNLLFETYPPGCEPASSKGCVCWLIDHGQCGLWPADKFPGRRGEQVPDDPAQIQGTGLRREGEVAIAERMDPEYRMSLKHTQGHARTRLLDQIRGVEDDAIEQAVQEVPASYMTKGQADATIALLKARRDALDTVLNEYWSG